MTSSPTALTDTSLLIVFAYAPAGLGHLRVTDALYAGLPSHTDAVILGSQDKKIQDVHRFTSTHPLARAIQDWLQSGPLAVLFAHIYSFSLRSHTTTLYQQVNTLLDQKLQPPKTLLFIATHFGLAHQLAAIKEKIAKERHIQIFLVVVVTDDTFHPMWYVKGANLIIVPSNKTKQRFLTYNRYFARRLLPIEVLPYPVSPNLALPLKPAQITDKVNQTLPDQTDHIHVLLPISGAAVGTHYFLHLIDNLKHLSSRYFFHVVARSAPYTHTFLSQLVKRESVELAVSPDDREVVDLYDRLFRKEIFSLEITKPSEQAFKALLRPETRGGVILLLSEAIGQQEHNNLDFLCRHFLLPPPALNRRLWQMAEEQKTLNTRTDPIFSAACTWRGICLPQDPLQAAHFIHWMLNQRLFYHMYLCKNLPDKKDPHPEELATNGVSRLWHLIASLISSQN